MEVIENTPTTPLQTFHRYLTFPSQDIHLTTMAFYKVYSNPLDKHTSACLPPSGHLKTCLPAQLPG